MVGPNWIYLIIFGIATPILIIFHPFLLGMPVYTNGLFGGAAAGVLVLFWLGSTRYLFHSDGITVIRLFVIRTRRISWRDVQQIGVIKYPRWKSDCLMIVLRGCDDFYPDNKSPEGFNRKHPLKSILIDYSRDGYEAIRDIHPFDFELKLFS